MGLNFKLYHKEAIAPFVYRDGTGWPASLPYIQKIRVSVVICTQSRISLHERVPMVKIWGSSPNSDYGKVVSFSHFLLVVAVVLHLCGQVINNHTELRETFFHTDRYP